MGFTRALSLGRVHSAVRLGIARIHPVREWWWDRDRSRLVATMLERERENNRAAAGLYGLVAVQLAGIRALPEVCKKRRV